MHLDLEQHRLQSSLSSLYLIPEFVSQEVEQHLLTEIQASKQAWRPVSGRRLQNWGGVVHKNGLIPAPLPAWLQRVVARVSAETGIYGRGQDQQLLQANHVLVNSYQPGEGILPHEDGPLYHPAVAILSLGSNAVLRFARKQQSDMAADMAAGTSAVPGPREAKPPEAEAHALPAALARLEASVICPPRSLLVFKDDAYTACLHGVLEAVQEPVDETVVNAEQCGVAPGSRLARSGERVSLTVRRVLRTHALGLRR